MSPHRLNRNALTKYTFRSPIGPITIAGDQAGVCSLLFAASPDSVAPDKLPAPLQSCYHQLIEYFDGKLTQFDIPLMMSGTEFQIKIWRLLLAIQCGKTISYQELAFRAGNRNLTRAVGAANSRNPIPIIVPCHRVIGSNGSLTGYAGGLQIKQWLIGHEQQHLKPQLF